eukprot:scaffold36609_cov70-Phaeocystis_antarctica.AAC.1
MLKAVPIRLQSVPREAAAHRGSASDAAPPPMSHARSKTACWGCDAEPGEGVKFQVCSRCSEAQLGTRAVYCSTECQRYHWSLHKRWHADQQQITDARRAVIERPGSGVAAREQELEARIAARAEAPSADAPTYKLLAQAQTCTQNGNFKRAVKYYDKAIQLSPENSDAHHNLGWAYQLSNDFVRAAACYLRATELTPSRGECWAQSISSADNALLHESCRCNCVPKPAWFGDPAQRLQMALQAYRWAPNYGNTCSMLGYALRGIGRTDEAKRYLDRGDMLDV